MRYSKPHVERVKLVGALTEDAAVISIHKEPVPDGAT
jgi:hypothetical protein